MRSVILASLLGSLMVVSTGLGTVPPPLYDPPGTYVPDYLQPPVREANLMPVRPAIVTTVNDQALRQTGRARLIIEAPLGSEVFVQGKLMADQFRTDEEGNTLFQSTRVFVSPVLAPNKIYIYNVRAKWHEGDRLHDGAQDVRVWPGAVVKLDFMEEEAPPP
jgi:hypothetical protein